MNGAGDQIFSHSAFTTEKNSGIHVGDTLYDGQNILHFGAAGDNVLQRIEPVMADRKFNPIPVRIIIDRYGKVKHVHVISAFPEQAKVITDALLQWEFKPYKQNGKPVEVETGIMFGNAPRQTNTATSVRD